MGGPELVLAPPAVNGFAILLSAVLGAKEYFGWTEAAVCESYRGVGEGDNAAWLTTCMLRHFSHTLKLVLLLHNPQPYIMRAFIPWYFFPQNLTAFHCVQTKCWRSVNAAILFVLAVGHTPAKVICCSCKNENPQKEKLSFLTDASCWRDFKLGAMQRLSKYTH